MQPSVINELAEIDRFVRWCAKQDDVGGFNVCISKHPGKSYVLAKSGENLTPLHALPVNLDYSDPIQRPLISNAIHKALYGKEMTPEAMEDEMVCKSN